MIGLPEWFPKEMGADSKDVLPEEKKLYAQDSEGNWVEVQSIQSLPSSEVVGLEHDGGFIHRSMNEIPEITSEVHIIRFMLDATSENSGIVGLMSKMLGVKKMVLVKMFMSVESMGGFIWQASKNLSGFKIMDIGTYKLTAKTSTEKPGEKS